MTRNRLTQLFALLLMAALTTPAFAAPPDGKGGGNGGGREEPPPEPVPVSYGLFVLSMPSDYAGGAGYIREMNEDGEGVGWYRAGNSNEGFYFDIHTGGSVVTNLNDIEIDQDYPIPSGWHIRNAWDINSYGDIAIGLSLNVDTNIIRGGVVELRPDPSDASVKPRVHLIPDSAWSKTFARAITDDGIVLGRGDEVTSYSYKVGLRGQPADSQVTILPLVTDAQYVQMNNFSELVFSDASGVWKYTLGDASATFLTSEVSLHGFSDSGAFCGTRNIRKNRTIGAIYDGTVIDIPEIPRARGLNSANDVVGNVVGNANGTTVYTSYLFHRDHGLILFDPLTMSQTDQSLWETGSQLFEGITERNVFGSDAPNFPIVYGSLRNDREYSFQYDAYVLFPMAPSNQTEAP